MQPPRPTLIVPRALCWRGKREARGMSSAKRIVARNAVVHDKETRATTPRLLALIAHRAWAGEMCGRRDVVGLTVQRFTCAARALVPKPERHAARCM